MTNDDLTAPTMTKAEVNMLIQLLSKPKHKALRDRLKQAIKGQNNGQFICGNVLGLDDSILVYAYIYML